VAAFFTGAWDLHVKMTSSSDSESPTDTRRLCPVCSGVDLLSNLINKKELHRTDRVGCVTVGLPNGYFRVNLTKFGVFTRWHFNHTIKLTHIMDVISCQYLLNIMHILASLPQIRRPVTASESPAHQSHHTTTTTAKKAAVNCFPLLSSYVLCMVVLNSDGEHVFI